MSHVTKSVTIKRGAQTYHFQRIHTDVVGTFYGAMRNNAKRPRVFSSLRDMQNAYPSFDLKELR